MPASFSPNEERDDGHRSSRYADPYAAIALARKDFVIEIGITRRSG
jgi:hypothetical protein